MDVASGIFAVLSISIQLTETVQKINTFCKSMPRAPEELMRLVGTLDRFEMILAQASLYLEQLSKISALPCSILAIEVSSQ